ncbi:nucleotide sugar dehydrogenase [Muribaculaceae bacterium Isolate-083 (Janvier)]|jgi:UDP-N-acetyl-D-galactosamine dehydrogenase|uniref:nucleotide sugar dehydrogenase n=2 Tax=Bacteroidia TaxID=200643 RepID=UPI000F4954F2|nr:MULTISPECIES: nucleotide sugar dehydrogenase [Bacteroidales]ROS93604.1 nucleotide sugar dehydrogenase [Muribaculaceae bacterium Isolate-077 (Janvier)]ROS94296.1 nucleotide sugar dehydrogenase [Muribaculaceae bacterium Isolate-083 (Janvier)]ROS96804.1 nucleotide sugar dehydrogenase [Muribaculaceae bacterium Isolate-084 (Janvier)]
MQNIKIAVIGLGYVGLPLARLFSTKYETIGFDMSQSRVDALMSGHDATLEVDDNLLQEAIANGFKCTTDINDIKDCNFYVVAVPTPVDNDNRPDLKPLWGASETVGKVISKGDIVVYESTVYPGVTEEECLPVVERVSGLKFNSDFYAGYSPERINPGDKLHTVEKIKKVTSGSTPEIADIVDSVYNSVLINGTHKAPSIKVAEASKIIENSQRDVNIAFMNELAKIFNAMGIDTHDVIEAAASKWNFIKLNPGLVGGHCISVDPYYLIQKAQVYGVLPRIMFSARRLNDGMGAYVANQTIKAMNLKGVKVKDAKILILGVTFKENCPDIRNTKIVDIYHTLKEYTSNITIFDPWANPEAVKREYSIEISQENIDALHGKFDAVILGVAHKQFTEINVRDFLADVENGVVYDVKGILPREVVDARL